MSIATGADFRFGTCNVGLTAALGLWRSSTNFGFLAAMCVWECVIDLILIGITSIGCHTRKVMMIFRYIANEDMSS